MSIDLKTAVIKAYIYVQKMVIDTGTLALALALALAIRQSPGIFTRRATWGIR